MQLFHTFAAFSRPAVEQPLPIACIMALSAFAGGATLGSFLNVVIARVPAGLSVVHPRSRCPSCLRQIAWYDNVPVLSWLLLRARCRACGTRISIRYPFVELCVGLLTCGLALRHGFSWTFAELLVFAATLVVVAFIDLDTWEIPLVFPTVLAVTGLSMGGMGDFGGHPWRMPHWLQLALPDQGSGLLERAVGLSAGFLSLACINVVATYVARRRGMIDPGEFAMGWGDPLLIAGMGAVLGWHALPWLIFLASFQGAVVGLALRLAGKMPAERETTKGEAGDESWVPPPSALPFGPFLALAGLEVALFGQSLASWSSVFLHISG